MKHKYNISGVDVGQTVVHVDSSIMSSVGQSFDVTVTPRKLTSLKMNSLSYSMNSDSTITGSCSQLPIDMAGPITVSTSNEDYLTATLEKGNNGVYYVKMISSNAMTGTVTVDLTIRSIQYHEVFDTVKVHISNINGVQPTKVTATSPITADLHQLKNIGLTVSPVGSDSTMIVTSSNQAVVSNWDIRKIDKYNYSFYPGGIGTATIRFESIVPSVFAEVLVNVVSVPITKVEFEEVNLYIPLNGVKDMMYHVTPLTAIADLDIEYVDGDESCIEVMGSHTGPDNNTEEFPSREYQRFYNLKGVKSGKVTYKVSYGDGKEAICYIRVGDAGFQPTTSIIHLDGPNNPTVNKTYDYSFQFEPKGLVNMNNADIEITAASPSLTNFYEITNKEYDFTTSIFDFDVKFTKLVPYQYPYNSLIVKDKVSGVECLVKINIEYASATSATFNQPAKVTIKKGTKLKLSLTYNPKYSNRGKFDNEVLENGQFIPNNNKPTTGLFTKNGYQDTGVSSNGDVTTSIDITAVKAGVATITFGENGSSIFMGTTEVTVTE